jgi:ACS family glucarate transporter-like MFS transporter
MVTINYIDRANLAIAGPMMAKEFGWSLTVLGFALSSIFWVYTPGLLFWGAILDVIGIRAAYAIGLVIWAVASVCTGFVNSFNTLIMARWAVGFGEAISPPASSKTVRVWMPARDRGFATGTFTAGYYLGPAIGFPLIATLVGAYGWRLMFVILGVATLVFLGLWLLLFSKPEESKWLSPEERDYIVRERDSTGQREVAGSVSHMSRADVFRSPTTWGLVLASGSAAYTIYVYLTWLPSYFLNVQHFNLAKSGWYSAIPYVVATAACFIVGRFTDRSLDAGRMERGGRRRYLIASMACSCSILLVPVVHNLWVILGLLALTLSGSSCTLTTNIALANDVMPNPKYAGLLFGITGVCSNALALLAPIFTGIIAQATGGFEGAFLLNGGICVVAIVGVLILVRGPIVPSVQGVVNPMPAVS